MLAITDHEWPESQRTNEDDSKDVRWRLAECESFHAWDRNAGKRFVLPRMSQSQLKALGNKEDLLP